MPRKCAVERAWDEMTDAERNLFFDWITNPTMTAGRIAELMRIGGYPNIDRAAVGHYRRKIRVGKVEI